MSNKNGKAGYIPNQYLYSRSNCNQPFSLNPNVPYIANFAQPSHPIPFQNQIYPQYSADYGSIESQENYRDAESAMLGLSLLGAATLLQNNYNPNIPVNTGSSQNSYDFSQEIQQTKEIESYPKRFDGSIHYNSLDQRKNAKCMTKSFTNESSSKELQASAQVFVPQNRSILEMTDTGIYPDKIPTSNQQDFQSYSVAERTTNPQKIGTINNVSFSSGYSDGARPKELNRNKDDGKPTNKKYFSHGRYVPHRPEVHNRYVPHWQSKGYRNGTFNEGRPTNNFNNFTSHSNYPLSETTENSRVSSIDKFNLDHQKINTNCLPKGYNNAYNRRFYATANNYARGNQNFNNQKKYQSSNIRKNEWRVCGKTNDLNVCCEGNKGNYRKQQQNIFSKKFQNQTNPSGSFTSNRKTIQEGEPNKQFGNEWYQNCRPEIDFSYERCNNAIQQFHRPSSSSSLEECNRNRSTGTSNGVDTLIVNGIVDCTSAPVTTEDNEKMQRENLIENLSKGVYECMVCCERIKQQHAIWSCSKCYNCFHLGCIKKWAGTSQGEPGWRCPACQNPNSKIPSGYFCFCKKMREPEWNRRETAHSCGEVCGKRRENIWCTHKCMILCHPGPCPDCSAFIKRPCQCGKTLNNVRCSQTEPFVCSEKCARVLNCTVHMCDKVCHIGVCEPCAVVIEEECFCKKEKREVLCTAETSVRNSFSCDEICGKTLACGNHTCTEICHDGPCSTCPSSIETVTTCPCGKMNLNVYFKEKKTMERKSCKDPIPTCRAMCGKTLKCGTPGSFHTCETECHEGTCPECKLQTEVRCRCGYMDTKIPCVELLTKADEIVCKKQCKKIRQCGRHKCGVKCCIDVDHVCALVCGRYLKCRVHKCQEPCHRGNCPRCWETSFEELSCHCGSSVLYPPIQCGTEPPACNIPCRRKQSCTHAVAHNCHTDPKCPPCTTLVSKPCFGQHTIMKSTPCYVSAMSCGSMCAKPLPCGKHVCQKVCHDGKCTKGNTCTQKCSEMRPSCQHPCNKTCHTGPCPNIPCKEMVTVTCRCSNRREDMSCSQNEKEYKSMTTTMIAAELQLMHSGESIDISHIFSGSTKPEKLKRLECNGECALLARNRQLALALQITNPDARDSLAGGEGYSNLFTDSMKDEAKKDLNFAQVVHTTLTDLVMKAKESKHKNRSHSFAPMNRDKRRFIHEYAKVFGCQSMAYDEEPKKNVVVTASKLMSRLPPTSVVTLIKKEQGQRKIPGPVINRKALRSDEMGKNGTHLKRLQKTSSFEKKEKESSKEVCCTTKDEQSAVIDYFDFT